VSFVLVWLTASHPLVALVLVLVLGSAAIYIVLKLSRFARRIFRRAA